MSHTQGKLRVSAYGIFTESDPRKIVAVMNRSDLEQEDARRLVACWNACGGAKTEDLEELGSDYIKPLIDTLDQRDELKAHRDELLAALTSYVTVIATAGGGDLSLFMAAIREADNAARAAIAKAVQS